MKQDHKQGENDCEATNSCVITQLLDFVFYIIIKCQAVTIKSRLFFHIFAKLDLEVESLPQKFL